MTLSNRFGRQIRPGVKQGNALQAAKKRTINRPKSAPQVMHISVQYLYNVVEKDPSLGTEHLLSVGGRTVPYSTVLYRTLL